MAAFFVAVLGATPVSASPRVTSDRELARSAAAAVRGRVEAVTPGWEGGAIYTWVTVAVDRAWGLDPQADRVVVKQLGGVVGDTALVVGGQATFAVGDRVFLLLDVRPRDRTLTVAGLAQGAWRAAIDRRGVARAWRRDTAAAGGGDDLATTTLESLGALAGTRTSAAGADARSAPIADWRDVAATAGSPIVGRWHDADEGRPVLVDREPSPEPAFALGGEPALAAALATWTAAGSLTLLPGGLRGPRCFVNAEPADGRITVTHGDPCDEIPDASPILAIGGAYFAADDIRDVQGRPYWRLTKGMVVTDGAPGKLASLPSGCVVDLLTHELGHAIGLDHVAEAGAVMAPALPASCLSRTTGTALTLADRAAMAAAYPRPVEPAAVPAVPPPPLALLTATVGATVTLAWAMPDGVVPAGYEIHAGSAPGLSDLAIVPLTATTLVASGVADGTYFVRVVAIDAVGASAPTPDVRVDVRAHAPAAVAGRVALAWSTSAPLAADEARELEGRREGDVATHVVPAGGDTLTVEAVAPGAYLVRLAVSGPHGPRALTPDARVIVPARP